MDSHRERLLLVADEPLVGSLKDLLRSEGYGVLTYNDSGKALRCVQTEKVDLVLFDIQLPGENGLEKLASIKKCSPEVPLLILTPAWNLEKAVRALEIGADNFIVSPVHLVTPTYGHAVRLQIARALEKKRIDSENRRLKQGLAAVPEPALCACADSGKDARFESEGNGNNSGDPKKIRPLKKALEGPEKKIILEALKAFSFNRQKTARALRINRTTLYNKMKRLGLLGKKLR